MRVNPAIFSPLSAYYHKLHFDAFPARLISSISGGAEPRCRLVSCCRIRWVKQPLHSRFVCFQQSETNNKCKHTKTLVCWLVAWPACRLSPPPPRRSGKGSRRLSKARTPQNESLQRGSEGRQRRGMRVIQSRPLALLGMLMTHKCVTGEYRTNATHFGPHYLRKGL